MRLIDGYQDRLSFREHLGKPAYAQPLRSDEQEVEIAGQVVDAALARSHATAAGMDALGAEAQSLQLAHLIVHQRYQR